MLKGQKTERLSDAIRETRHHYEQYGNTGMQSDGQGVRRTCSMLKEWENTVRCLESVVPLRPVAICEVIPQAFERLHLADDALKAVRREMVSRLVNYEAEADPDGSLARAIDTAIADLVAARALIASRVGTEVAA